MRVSELAKELGKSSKEVLDVLQKQGYGEKTHSSNVSDEQTQLHLQNQSMHRGPQRHQRRRLPLYIAHRMRRP